MAKPKKLHTLRPAEEVLPIPFMSMGFHLNPDEEELQRALRGQDAKKSGKNYPPGEDWSKGEPPKDMKAGSKKGKLVQGKQVKPQAKKPLPKNRKAQSP